VPGRRQRSRASSSNDGNHASGHRIAVAVDKADLIRMIAKIRQFAQKVSQPFSKRCLAGSSGFAPPPDQPTRKFSNTRTELRLQIVFHSDVSSKAERGAKLRDLSVGKNGVFVRCEADTVHIARSTA
jgi:hypothetical protein